MELKIKLGFELKTQILLGKGKREPGKVSTTPIGFDMQGKGEK
jgi:hypothetical protein